MPPTSENLWQRLRPGDRVRIVHYPCEFSEPDYTMRDETRAAYRHIIESREALTVGYLDDDGYPWVEFAMSDSYGEIEYHYLMLNHDGIERVEENGR